MRIIGENEILFKVYNHMEQLIGDEMIIFIGSLAYIDLFFELIKGFENDKIIFYEKQEVMSLFPEIHNNKTYKFMYFETTKR
jgi:hypothetical protein